MNPRTLTHAIAAVLIAAAPLEAAVPQMIGYQGQIKVTGTPYTGSGQFKFAILNRTNGASLWSNDGTSVNGAAPTAAVTLGVTNGLFNILLGDTTLANMQFVPDSTFAGRDNVALRVWFNDGVRGWEQISPDARLGSVPFAMSAHLPNGSVTGSQLALGTIDPTRLLVANTPQAGRVLSYDNGGFNWTDLSVVNTNWVRSGTVAYYNAGNVGIGTATPTSKLDIEGPQDALRITGYQPVLTMRDSSFANARSVIQSVNGGLNLFTERYLAGQDSFGFMRFDTSGNVGIGSSAPVGKLEVVAQDALRLIGYQPFLTLFDDSAGYARGRIQSVSGGLNFFTESYLSGVNPLSYFVLNNSGNVGIGASQPVSKLEVVAQDALSLIGYQPFLTLKDSNAGYARSRIQGINGTLVFQTEASMNGTSPNGYAILNGSGNLNVGTITIRGGADLAEPFPMSVPNIAKGSVVVIDSKKPGHLKLSDRPYDKRVAGIVSGANGINPGIALHQEGALDQGENVALTGRVYVQADASHGIIEPGDLLTTSDTLGHAMKVADSTKAQGAILGKAMTGLNKGRGLVLVLVTLQ